MKEPVFTGVATAIVTPFVKNEIDFEGFDLILARQMQAGISAVVVCGTTGEASTLSTEEKEKLLRHTVAYCAGRCKVIAGVGTNSTASSIRLAAMAASCGADALLAVTPY